MKTKKHEENHNCYPNGWNIPSIFNLTHDCDFEGCGIGSGCNVGNCEDTGKWVPNYIPDIRKMDGSGHSPTGGVSSGKGWG